DLDYPLYLSYRSIESKIKEGISKANYYRNCALIEAYLGNYEAAVKKTDLAKLQPTEMIFFDSLGEMRKQIIYPKQAYAVYNQERIDSVYQSVNFFDFLESTEINAKVFSINESHAIPLGRYVWAKLLPILKEKGYQYLAMETLYINNQKHSNDSEFIEKGSGYFSSEVLSGEVQRKAKELGFKLVAYDAQVPNITQVQRDSISFQNILSQTFHVDKDAKIVLYAGHGHIGERPIGKIKNFGSRFKEMGIDPITIHQFSYYDRNVPEHIQHPTLLIRKKNTGNEFYDYTLIMPATKIIHTRPNWIWDLGRTPYTLKKDCLGKLNYPCVIEAYQVDAPLSTVPVDRVEIKNDTHLLNLALSKGWFRIVCIDKFGERTTKKIFIP
ncbi:MAG: hypothetical protein AAF705_08405, partial [Bacteroidota bacterium]